MTKNYSKANVEDKEVPFDPSQIRKVQEHPCFSKDACHRFGRLHLAVAPKCNIQCNYCVKEYDCVNETRPGVTSDVLSPQEALERTRKVMEEYPETKVIGVAGPGEPLYNKETFETFELVKKEFPERTLCISTNGLLLPDKIEKLDELGVLTVTVTLNAVDPEIGKEIYSYVRYKGKKYTGIDAAKKLLEKQLEGLREAVEREMVVKVNTVYIPGINEDHIIDIAKKINSMGVYIQNIMPLIPQYKFSDLEPPSPEEKQEMQDRCSDYVKQMRHCRQCRADAVGKLGEDKSDCFLKDDE